MPTCASNSVDDTNTIMEYSEGDDDNDFPTELGTVRVS